MRSVEMRKSVFFFFLHNFLLLRRYCSKVGYFYHLSLVEEFPWMPLPFRLWQARAGRRSPPDFSEFKQWSNFEFFAACERKIEKIQAHYIKVAFGWAVKPAMTSAYQPTTVQKEERDDDGATAFCNPFHGRRHPDFENERRQNLEHEARSNRDREGNDGVNQW